MWASRLPADAQLDFRAFDTLAIRESPGLSF
jgi:hypothetical protein